MQNPKEISLLSDVHQTLLTSPESSQRDISKALNMSLGMTNNILKRFVEKGWRVCCVIYVVVCIFAAGNKETVPE